MFFVLWLIQQHGHIQSHLSVNFLYHPSLPQSPLNRRSLRRCCFLCCAQTVSFIDSQKCLVSRSRSSPKVLCHLRSFMYLHFLCLVSFSLRVQCAAIEGAQTGVTAAVVPYTVVGCLLVIGYLYSLV